MNLTNESDERGMRGMRGIAGDLEIEGRKWKLKEESERKSSRGKAEGLAKALHRYGATVMVRGLLLNVHGLLLNVHLKINRLDLK
ncbi:hypothetical protein AB6D20_027690 (plasmid) [Vibrio splendidus]